jgi:hypothetical protein
MTPVEKSQAYGRGARPGEPNQRRVTSVADRNHWPCRAVDAASRAHARRQPCSAHQEQVPHGEDVPSPPA